MTETNPGIDVGKANLALSLNAGPTRNYNNDPEGIAALTLKLAAQSITLAVHEPTGGYERPLGQGLRRRRTTRPPGERQPGARLRPGLRTARQNR